MVVTNPVALLFGWDIGGHVTDCEGSSVTIIVGDNIQLCNTRLYNLNCCTGYFVRLSYFKYNDIPESSTAIFIGHNTIHDSSGKMISTLFILYILKSSVL